MCLCARACVHDCAPIIFQLHTPASLPVPTAAAKHYTRDMQRSIQWLSSRRHFTHLGPIYINKSGVCLLCLHYASSSRRLLTRTAPYYAPNPCPLPPPPGHPTPRTPRRVESRLLVLNNATLRRRSIPHARPTGQLNCCIRFFNTH